MFSFKAIVVLPNDLPVNLIAVPAATHQLACAHRLGTAAATRQEPGLHPLLWPEDRLPGGLRFSPPPRILQERKRGKFSLETSL